MTQAGSWWLAKQELLEGETILSSRLANRFQGAMRAVGGKLYLTNRRLLFCPHLIDYMLAGKKWSSRLDEIASVSIKPRDFNLLKGGIRDRLKIDLKNGSEEIFLVNRLDEVIQEIRTAAGMKLA